MLQNCLTPAVSIFVDRYCLDGRKGSYNCRGSKRSKRFRQNQHGCRPCAFFLIFNKKVSLLEVPCVDAKCGAGPRSADLLTGKKVNVVIAGHCRQKMMTILTTQKIQFVERQGIAIRTVEEQAHAE